MMPPAGARRPEPSSLQSLASWLENELDRNAVVYLPPPGLHRLNRTEYANVMRDLLALEVDPSKLLPSDDSSHGFDNIAGTLGLSSTLVEAYVSAAQTHPWIRQRRPGSVVREPEKLRGAAGECLGGLPLLTGEGGRRPGEGPL